MAAVHLEVRPPGKDPCQYHAMAAATTMHTEADMMTDIISIEDNHHPNNNNNILLGEAHHHLKCDAHLRPTALHATTFTTDEGPHHPNKTAFEAPTPCTNPLHLNISRVLPEEQDHRCKHSI
jgi:hypothetical protein